MKGSRHQSFDPGTFVLQFKHRTTMKLFHQDQVVFSQGDKADAVFFIQSGRIELRVLSREGKQAILGILGSANFFGEGCLAGQTVRMATAITLAESEIVQIEKAVMIRMLQNEVKFSAAFVSYLLTRNLRIEEDLIDQLFNSSEKRLARVLLLLANFGQEGEPKVSIPHISQSTLAEMVGTTRSRVSFFMNKFRRMGFIEYNGSLRIHSSLLNVIIHD